MSVKNKRIVVRPKRFTYVDDDSRNSSAEQSLSSSDDDMDEVYEQPKVRNGFSIKNLMKNSEKFQSGDDHMYTKNGTPDLSIQRETRTTRKNGREVSERSKTLKRKVSSDYYDEGEMPGSKRQKCSSKNAIMARLNRERKKQYIASLESENENLRNENNKINDKVSKQDKMIASLRHEVVYLKSFLANSKEICQILQNLSKSTGLPVTTSITSNSVQKPATKPSPEHGYVSETESELSQPAKAAVKSVKYDLPIKSDDVNLGSFSSREEDDEMFSLHSPYLENLESPLFPFETDDLIGDPMNDFNFDLKPSNADLLLDSFLDFNADPLNEKSSGDFSRVENLTDVGICLHVNKKKISVELCSLCSSKASASMKN